MVGASEFPDFQVIRMIGPSVLPDSQIVTMVGSSVSLDSQVENAALRLKFDFLGLFTSLEPLQIYSE